MPARHGGRGRQAPRGQKPKYLWTTVLLNQFAVLTTISEVNIIEPADWERGPTSFERATLVRCRGWLHTRVNSLSANSLFMYIGLYDEDEAGSLADVVGTYDSEDILWTDGYCQPSANFDGDTSQHWGVDVKANRKITSANELRLVMTTTNAANQFVSGVIRACIKYT